jgi:hypothetical protein
MNTVHNTLLCPAATATDIWLSNVMGFQRDNPQLAPPPPTGRSAADTAAADAWLGQALAQPFKAAVGEPVPLEIVRLAATLFH